MTTREGKAVCAGVAIGKIWVYPKEGVIVGDTPAQSPKDEWRRFITAKETADKQLEALYQKTRQQVGTQQAEIFEIHRMMLQDLDYLDAVESMIKKQDKNAAYAVQQTGHRFAEVFSDMQDEYMQARAADVVDISRRLVEILSGTQAEVQLEAPAIVVAEDLTPSETVQLDKSKILAFVIRGGSSNSHTAILARTMNIPSVVQVDIPVQSGLNGKTMVVDGFTGTCYIDPDNATLEKMREKQQKEEQRRLALEAVRGLETITQNGKKIHLYANIGQPDDLPAAIAGDAEGIGLFRSEFLYIGRDKLPTEEEQFTMYKAVVEGMQGKRVIIRTMDIGADKKADYLKLDKEENPALGYRAIRISLDKKELFKTQLRAIYRAAAFGTVSVMFPMITSLWEVQKCKEIARDVQQGLQQKNIATGAVELGIMVETPAAVMISADLAKEVAFFSVGTNDLTQYTLAIDRENAKLDTFYDARHPAVLAMLELVAKNARENGIWAGICGELGADTTLTETFVRMGYEELSVSPGKILELRKIIRGIEL